VKHHHYSPLRYPGGKNCVFPFVSKLFYENDLIGTSYAEPYAGGSGLALRLLFEGYVNHIYINDLDKSIFSFWKVVLERTDEFCDWLENVEVSIPSWNAYKKIQMSEEVNEFELAISTFFLNRTNVSGVIKGGVIGGKQQYGKYKIDARFNKQDLIGRIQQISKYREYITVSNLDGKDFIRRIDKKREDVFVYLDPPYYHKGADLYMNFFSDKDHKSLCKQVYKLRKKWLVSYDNHDFIVDLYPDQMKIIHKLSQSASNRVGDEIFIFSDELSYSDSLIGLKSPASIL